RSMRRAMRSASSCSPPRLRRSPSRRAQRPPERSPAGTSRLAAMPNLLALSFEGTLTPAFDLRCLETSHTPPDGWGIACYPGGEPAALVMKEANPAHGSIRSALVSAWERLESSIFVVHIRTATWGALTEANTQPFQRAWGRRDWLIAHSGSLEHRLPPPGRFEPVGSTDREPIPCELLGRAAEQEWKTLADAPPHAPLGWFHDL